MKKKETLELLGGGPTNCGGGSCPAVYKDGEGRIFVQGTKLSNKLKGQISVDLNEDVIELTTEMLAVLKKL